VAHLERRLLQVQELLLEEEIPAEGHPPVDDTPDTSEDAEPETETDEGDRRGPDATAD
jgi:hypothetical protein